MCQICWGDPLANPAIKVTKFNLLASKKKYYFDWYIKPINVKSFMKRLQNIHSNPLVTKSKQASMNYITGTYCISFDTGELKPCLSQQSHTEECGFSKYLKTAILK